VIADCAVEAVGFIWGFITCNMCSVVFIEGSLEVKLPTIWTDEKQSRAEAERRGRLEERRSEEKE
jgi:hypothetical protein